MPNVHGALFALRALGRPGRIVPGIKVDTIARLDFVALKQAGYTGAVFDRDNCLDAWARCKSTFGPSNVLVVSNSAGTEDDPLGIQAESLSFNLGVPVLRHSKKKPACAGEILGYFRRLSIFQSSTPPHPVLETPHPRDNPDPPSLNEPPDPDSIMSVPALPLCPSVPLAPAPRLLVIGDRLMTDVLLASSLGPSHLGIWTTRLWSRPDVPLIRAFEQAVLRTVLWSRNQTFRHGVLEARARGENWLGQERWTSWIRRMVVGILKRASVPPEPIPPPTNQLARFVLPIPAKAILAPQLPTTRLGWIWHYSKHGMWYATKIAWMGLAWLAARATLGASRAWTWGLLRIKEAKARRVGVVSHVKS
ncbi:phosphatidylglycerophosphatase GEP4, mitochondrial [Ceratobasidium sp. AG-Ba]|nr:phosphatidylglycerophosphatase GEP4, mitochondrial [Ceratobasidium sp. AG-Ba]